MSFMSSRGVQVKRKLTVEGASATFKDNEKANFIVERMAFDSTDNASVIEQHGEEGAEEFISVMLRCQGTKEGRFKRKCVFQKLYINSTNAVRAQKDLEFLQAYVAIASENDPQLWEDFEAAGEDEIEDILTDVIGTTVGATVGVMTADGRTSEFVRSLATEFDFDAQVEKETMRAVGDASSRRSRRGASADAGAKEPEPTGRRERRRRG